MQLPINYDEYYPDELELLDPTIVFTEKQQGSSWFSAALIVINAALGAALLEFPSAYHQAGGVVTALLIQFILVAFVVAALLILAYCSDFDKTSTYQEVISSVCGYWGRLTCSLSITIYCFGTCITFLIIIGDQWDEVFKAVFHGDSMPWYVDRRFTIAVSTILLILPMCFFKRIDFLSKASAIGVIGVLYMAFFIVIKYFTSDFEASGIKTKPTEWTDVFLVVPTICFGYQCHVSAIPVYACLKDRCVKEFAKTVVMAITACILFYSITAVFGYLSFGASIKPDIMDCYENPTWDVTLGVALFAIKTYTTYPILQFCGRNAFDSTLFTLYKISPEREAATERLRRIIVTIVWFFLTLLCAIVAKNIKQVIDLLGCMAAVFIFIYPGLCLFQIALWSNDEILSQKQMLLIITAVIFVAIGTFVFGITIAQQIQKF